MNILLRGSTIDTIYIKIHFRNWPISLPSVEEQTAIANYLDKKTAQIDDFIAKKQKLIELLKEERTAIINEAVSGGLNHDSPDLYDKHDSKTKKSGNQTNHKNHSSDNWERKKLKYIAFALNSGDGNHQIRKIIDCLEEHIPCLWRKWSLRDIQIKI